MIEDEHDGGIISHTDQNGMSFKEFFSRCQFVVLAQEVEKKIREKTIDEKDN